LQNLGLKGVGSGWQLRKESVQRGARHPGLKGKLTLVWIRLVANVKIRNGNLVRRGMPHVSIGLTYLQ